MPFRPFSLLPLVGALLLGGCALAPVDDTPPPQTITPAEFDAGISRVVAEISGQCSTSQRLLADNAAQNSMMTADIREVGSQLRSLRSQVEALDSRSHQPRPVVSQCQPAVEGLANKELLGRSEWIGLPTVGTYLNARIASGANTSILSASEITNFERDGESWVRFKLGLNDDDEVVDSVRSDWIEAPIEREATLTQESGEETRPVVSLLMTLGPIREQVDFILSDRPSDDFPVMLGRRFLMDIAVVDVSQNNLHKRPEFNAGE
ncbi:RimK/LysX family protein [Halomonas cupida]|uniref:ATP-dependent zinc protease family protein n=1 Tax=Halomonas cupida TaxID=44933 RepID=UPI0039B420BB